MSEFHEQRLDNGLRVWLEFMPDVSSAAVGFLVRTGARDEPPEQAGVSHFLEHMCFKGTPKRDWRQVTVDFDEMGSTYNAFTSKEKTVYFGWVRAADLERQTELLADMMRSRLPSEEFETERKVILEEIAMSEDQLDRHLYELLHEKIYGEHPLGWPVLGHTRTVSALQRDQMAAYFEERYNPANLVLIVAGNVPPPRAWSVAQEVCGAWTARAPRPPRSRPEIRCGGVASSRLPRFKQQAVALVYPAPSAVDPDDETAEALAAILGGQNSRFFWRIVQAGIAPVASAVRVDYSDNGLMIVYGFCEPPNAERLVDALRREIGDLVERGAEGEELQRVKNRRRTSLATESEAPYYRLMQLAQDLDMFGRPRNVEERLAAVDAVSVAGLQDYLRRWPMNDEHFLVSVGPRAWPSE